MKRIGDFFFLFLFILIFSGSTLILLQSFTPPGILMATPWQVFQEGLTVRDMEGLWSFIPSNLIPKGERAFFGFIQERGLEDLLSLRIPLLLEDEQLPSLNFQGIEEIKMRTYSSLQEGRVIPGDEVLMKREPPPLSPLSQPSVIILHSHTAETFRGDPLDVGTGHVSPGEEGLITRVGQELARSLQENYGISVYHERKVHDQYYSLSYLESRKTLQHLLHQYPEPDLILDLHRDALGISLAQETTGVIGGQKVARILIIVGSDGFALSHPRWRENLQFANLLGERMEKMYPGLLRRVVVRENQHFNQDLHPNYLLLEIGDYSNSLEEAIRSVHLLAKVLYSLLIED